MQLNTQQMLQVLDRHLDAEGRGDIDEVMATMSPDAVWIAHPDELRFSGAEAVRANYTALLNGSGRPATMVSGRTWADEGRQEAVTEFFFESARPDDEPTSYSMLVVIGFHDGLIRTETIYCSTHGVLVAQ